jgi:ribose transport system permease protein
MSTAPAKRVAETSRATKVHRGVYRWIGPLWVWGVLIALVILAIYTVPQFATLDNYKNILKQAVPLAIVAIGQTGVIILGGIDLSVAAVIALGDTLCMGIMNGGEGSIVFAILAPLALGALIGAANGLVVAKTAAPAFIVTLGAASIVQGAVFWYTDSGPYGAPALSFGELGFKEYGPLPALVVLFIPILVAALIVQNRTRAGRHAYAVGDDDQVAARAGVNVTRVKVGTYALCGLLAALAGIAVATRTGSGEPLSGTGFDWDSISAVVIGGAILVGGRGTVGGTIAGVLIIALIENAMTLKDVSPFWQSTVKGVIVLIAVIIAALSAKDSLRQVLRWRPMAAFRPPPTASPPAATGGPGDAGARSGVVA